MAAYTINSDKLFLGSYDIDEGIQVYELSSLYTYPVKSKHWKHLDFDISLGKKYEALNIEEKEIWGDHLLTLTKELFESGLMVNREGLCFLPTRPSTAMDLGVEYYRMFDLFDWSKYGVTTSIKTRWARRDIVGGTTLEVVGTNFGDDYKEYEEELRAKLEEVEEMKRRLKEQEQDFHQTVSQKTNGEIDNKELEKEGEKQQDLNEGDLREGDLNAGENEVTIFEEELKLYVFERSGLSSTWDFYSKIAEKLWTDIPPVTISINLDYERSNWPPTGSPDMVIPLTLSESSLPQITLLCSSSDKYIQFDYENWRAIKVAVPTLSKTELEYKPIRRNMAYYEGSDFAYLASSYDARVSFPSPCVSEHIQYFGPLELKHIVGVGTRLVYFYSSFELPSDGL